MKKSRNIKFLFVLSFLTLFFSCRNNDCFTPPEKIVFELLNSNNENIIANGTIDISKVKIQEKLADGISSSVEIEKQNDNKIILKGAGWF